MFRDIRREKRALTAERSYEILKAGSYGVLSVLSDDGYPYGVPINYVYHNRSIYMHCAKEGQKIDAIMDNDKVSFCVVGGDTIIQEKFTTQYESVILNGKAIIIDDEEDKKEGLMALIKRFAPDFLESGRAYVNRDHSHTHVIKIEIEHITGKGNVD